MDGKENRAFGAREKLKEIKVASGITENCEVELMGQKLMKTKFVHIILNLIVYPAIPNKLCYIFTT